MIPEGKLSRVALVQDTVMDLSHLRDQTAMDRPIDAAKISKVLAKI